MIHLANFDDTRFGGGWTFSRNFIKCFGQTSYEESKIYLIAGPTLASHDDIDRAKRDGKKVVFRVDNAVRNSRNRGTGMTRMKAFAEKADLIIYQSQWARKFLRPFLQRDGKVILNGVDTNHFQPTYRISEGDKTYLYVRSSRDEGKQWIMAWYWFVNQKGHLDIVGKFSPENLEWAFDFYNGEKFSFLGEQTDMAPIYQRNRFFLYTYLNDACSNTLLEARASGCEIIDVYGMLKTGGAPEIMDCPDISLQRMKKEYEEAFSGL